MNWKAFGGRYVWYGHANRVWMEAVGGALVVITFY